MHAQVYHEGVWKKGANNVTSLIIRTLAMKQLREEKIGGKLNITYNNCIDQNKNNTVLKVLVYLLEMGYLKTINFIFLVIYYS